MAHPCRPRRISHDITQTDKFGLKPDPTYKSGGQPDPHYLADSSGVRLPPNESHMTGRGEGAHQRGRVP